MNPENNNNLGNNSESSSIGNNTLTSNNVGNSTNNVSGNVVTNANNSFDNNVVNLSSNSTSTNQVDLSSNPVNDFNTVNYGNMNNLNNDNSSSFDFNSGNNNKNTKVAVVLVIILLCAIGVASYYFIGGKEKLDNNVVEKEESDSSFSGTDKVLERVEPIEEDTVKDKPITENPSGGESKPVDSFNISLTCKKFNAVQGVGVREVISADFDSVDLYIRKVNYAYVLDFAKDSRKPTDAELESIEKQVRYNLEQQFGDVGFFQMDAVAENNSLIFNMSSDYDTLMSYFPYGFIETGEFYYPVFRKLYVSNGYTCSEN